MHLEVRGSTRRMYERSPLSYRDNRPNRKSLGAQNSRDVAKLFGITTDQLDQLRYGTVDTKTAIVLAARANTLRAAADKLDEAAA